ncbi:hypothetical protein AAFN85_12150 [Mucilaginibacter sp. CAU 1740]|uniref:hypothetical protein n=1 Tax=Mucilaginibacter sp. CAU 1740 TaxID=3140365 RepID=UPI00325B0989
MNTKQSDNIIPATFVKTTTIIHLALVMGQVLFAATTLLNSKNRVQPQSDDLFKYMAPALALSGFVIGHFLFLKFLGNIKRDSPLKTKLAAYQSATIVRLALLEGPSLFAIVCFMLTRNMMFIGISGAIILYFIYLRPTRQKVEDDLALDYNEKAELN